MSEELIKCPKCKSSQLSANKKGFSGKKAVAGALLTGGIGLLAGTIGSKNIIITCLACGHEFKPGEGTTDEKEKQQAEQNSINAFEEISRAQRGEARVENKQSEGCFIATACYGDYSAPEVIVFRRFRDEFLKKHIIGRVFIRLYYTSSPPIASLIENSESAKKVIRKILLKPLLYLLK